MRSLRIPKAFGTHTFASRIPQIAGQKSVLFGNPKRNSFFFSHPTVFYFFATHNRHINSLTETAKTFTHSDLTMTVDRRPACNRRLVSFKTRAVQYSADTFVVNQSLVLRINIYGKNRHLRQAPKCYAVLQDPMELAQVKSR